MAERLLRYVVLFAATLLASVVTLPAPALAQAPRVSFRLSSREVRVGEPFTATMLIRSQGSQQPPSEPALRIDRSVRGGPPSTTMSARVEVVNGRMIQDVTLTATWQLVATREGKLEIGPASFHWNGRTYETQREHVVVEKGGASPSPIDPQGDDAPPAPTEPGVSLDEPLEPIAFLRAVVDKDRAVVGEQVTMTVQLYLQRRARALPLPTDPHEPNGVDFSQRVLSTGEPDARPVSLGGAAWTVQTLRKIAFFPLHAGELGIEPMSLTLEGDGLRGRGVGGGLVRTAQRVVIHVTEPPADGRPPGYRIGDVGSYALDAEVEPRAVPAGGSVAVRILLRGTGNLPFDVRLPEKPGLTFLESERRELWDTRGDVVGGARVLTYLARLDEPGTTSLGDVLLPHWDPRAGAYRVARASLGVVQVLPGDGARPPTRAPDDPLARIGPPRATLGPIAPPLLPLRVRHGAWLVGLSLPFAALALELSRTALRRLRKRPPPDSSAARLSRALGKGQPRDAAFADKVLRLAVEARAGIGGSMLLDELGDALIDAGVPQALALEVVDALRRAEDARYAPDGREDPALVTEAERLARRLVQS